ncbi:LysR family transcriptional regulator protein [Rhizobium etli 8C-3]|uniref:HTH-type transcriptional regulator TtuA n=2 Tax=Rhizobium TaxID=379 RepID=A0A4R3RN81_9HYPH|nr:MULTISPECIES: LysR family transcriptional regulator [Rhizobium]APO76811.1 LysR family transcriptional regulator protein [Rhizobium etli 8C-3]TCU23787.1 LysR family transcriptional regulator [Rhizobium azibense]TCU36057.1 LysR family transcriptional regulator [Rhizobium azibense]
MTIDLHHLRHFVAVAEELHFGRAAARLHMAQPPLSQSIKRLEAELGFPLFLRTQRRVELTPAGQVFLTEARRTLQQMDEGVRMARRAASEDLAEITVTFTSAALYRVLPAALRAHRQRFPTVDIRLDERPTDAQLAGLQDDSVDVGFVTPPLKAVSGLQIEVVDRDRFCLAVPVSSPLANRNSIGLAELSEESFVLFPHVQGPSLHGRLVSACRQAGFVPRVRQEARQMHTILSLVAADLGVAFIPEGARSMQVNGVAMVPLAGMPDDLTWDLAMVWKPRGARRALVAFLQTVTSLPPS